jgi:ABC-type multidrug transport system fused ATPase/permease subunit
MLSRSSFDENDTAENSEWPIQSDSHNIPIRSKTKHEFQTSQSGISLREVSPVDVAVRNISVTVDAVSKTRGILQKVFPGKAKVDDAEAISPSISLLENVSADMPRGTLTAIIGASGSGKSTLYGGRSTIRGY